MSVPVLTFFNNKGGVGKTSLVYHLSWMFTELGHRVLAVDLDPQANLTSAFLDEDRLEHLWEDEQGAPSTIFRCVKPLTEVGDVLDPQLFSVTPGLALIPGDLALSGFEDTLSPEWPASMGDQNLIRPFRVLTAFWQVMQRGAEQHHADVIVIDVGPNLGAINRSALIASNHVVIPLGPDLFSLQGLRNLGPTLRSWRTLWRKRVENWGKPAFGLPQGEMKPLGYLAQQHSVRLDRPVHAYDRWLNRMPLEYRQSVLAENAEAAPLITQDPHCLALLKHYRSLMPMAQEVRKPMFFLKVADGAIGAHASAVQGAYRDFQTLARKVLEPILQPALI